jgi:hypothetical protein
MLQESDFVLNEDFVHTNIDELKETLEDIDAEWVDVNDKKDSCWQNDDSTLVFKISLSGQTEDNLANLILTLVNARPDECDCQYIEDESGDETLVYRLWWD